MSHVISRDTVACDSLASSAIDRVNQVYLTRRQVNPLARIPFFERCREMVSLFIGSGDAAQLQAGIQRLVGEATTPNGTIHPEKHSFGGHGGGLSGFVYLRPMTETCARPISTRSLHKLPYPTSKFVVVHAQ